MFGKFVFDFDELLVANRSTAKWSLQLLLLHNDFKKFSYYLVTTTLNFGCIFVVISEYCCDIVTLKLRMLLDIAETVEVVE